MESTLIISKSNTEDKNTVYSNEKMFDFFSEWIEKFARGITLFIVNAHGKCMFVSRIRPSQQFFSYSALLSDTTWWV